MENVGPVDDGAVDDAFKLTLGVMLGSIVEFDVGEGGNTPLSPVLNNSAVPELVEKTPDPEAAVTLAEDELELVDGVVIPLAPVLSANAVLD